MANGVKEERYKSTTLFSLYRNPSLDRLHVSVFGCDIKCVYMGARYRMVMMSQ